METGDRHKQCDLPKDALKCCICFGEIIPSDVVTLDAEKRFAPS
jgi:hypothetical protein